MNDTQTLIRRPVVAASFETREQAEDAVARLVDAGFDLSNIGVAMRSHREQETLIEHTGAHRTAEPLVDIVEGGIIGGVVGALLSFSVLSVPGVGAVLAAGVLASAMAGVGIGAAAGGIQAALTHQGLSEDQANTLETHFNGGAAVVTVQVPTDHEISDGDLRRVYAASILLSESGGIVQLSGPEAAV